MEKHPVTPKTQADRIFAKFGGAPKLATVFKKMGPKHARAVSTLYRWNLPRPRGSGGVVPACAVPDVNLAAEHAGVTLTAADWDPRKT